eukprot:3821821-Rhodomonas_salina.1
MSELKKEGPRAHAFPPGQHGRACGKLPRQEAWDWVTDAGVQLKQIEIDKARVTCAGHELRFSSAGYAPLLLAVQLMCMWTVGARESRPVLDNNHIACTYAALILHDEGLTIDAENIVKLTTVCQPTSRDVLVDSVSSDSVSSVVHPLT